MQTLEDLYHVVFVAVGVRFVGSSGVAPFRLTIGIFLCNFWCQCEVAGIVEVYAHHDAVGSICWQHKVVFQCKRRTRRIGRHTDPACSVVAASSTDGVHHQLVPLVECSVLFAAIRAVFAPAPAAVLYLVERFEDQEVAFVFECLGNLFPGLGDTVFDAVVGEVVVSGLFDFEPVLIVVQVQNDVQSGSLCPFHVLFHLSHVGGIDGPVAIGCVLVVTPGHTDTHGAGTGIL